MSGPQVPVATTSLSVVPLAAPDGRPVRRLASRGTLHEPLPVLTSATDEVDAARALAAGRDVREAAPRRASSWRDLRVEAGAAGAAGLRAWRLEPGLRPWLETGAWTRATAGERLRRRALLAVPARVAAGLPGRPAATDRLADAAYWRGVRAAATREEWRALTTGYVSLYYHRVAGELLPGQERLDLRPQLFDRQVRLLRLLGRRPLGPDELLAAVRGGALPRRGVVLTLDDGYLDALDAAERAAVARPQVFLPTALMGGVAAWADDAPLADWDRVRRAADAGVVVGAHGRHHRPMAGLPSAELTDEVAGGLRELRSQVPAAPPLLAYPNGRHDLATVTTARDAGYEVAWTTLPGANGAGTHPLCLRRTGVKDWDGLLGFAWKAVTGEPLPPLWEKVALRIWRRSAPRGRVH